MGCCLGEDANLAAAPLAQSLFFRPRERRPPMGRRRHTMAVEALVSPRATRLSSRRSSRRSSQRNSVHKWQKTVSRGHSRRLVYTLASPRPARATLTLQQCTQMAKNCVERPFSPTCVHCCVPTTCSHDPRVATVYTNAPKRRQEAVFANLCTLFASGGKPTLRDPRGRPPARPTRASKAEPPPYGRGHPANATDGLPMR